MLTVGKLLLKSRQEKNISLKQAERQTRIRSKYLEAIEDEDWSVFSSRIYITGAIKTYATFLDIDPDHALAYFRRDYVKKEVTTFKKRIPRLQFLPETKKIVIGSLFLIFIFFLFYFGYQFSLYLSPPTMEILSPPKRVFRNVERIRIIGKTQKESVITIFNNELYPDEKGIFQYDFPLKKGKNKVTIKIIGPNGKTASFVEDFVLE